MEIPSLVRWKVAQLQPAVLRMFNDVAARSEFILKTSVSQFEAACAEFFGVTHCVATSSLPDAYVLALRAMTRKASPVLLVPALGWERVAHSAGLLGIQQVRMLDVEANGAALCQERFESPVEIAVFNTSPSGQRQTDLQRDLRSQGVQTVAEGWGISLVGPSLSEQIDVAILSLDPGELLGGLGEGAILLTRSDELARRMRQLRNHGQDGKTRFLHHEVGYNYRMDEVNAGVLLDYLRSWNPHLSHLQHLRQIYHSELAGMGCFTEVSDPNSVRAYDFLVLAERRNELIEYCSQHGVILRTYFDLSVHGFDRQRFPGSVHFAERHVLLPFHPGLDESALRYTCSVLRDFYER